LWTPASAAALPDEVYVGLAHLILNETGFALLAEVSEADVDDMLAVERIPQAFWQRVLEIWLYHSADGKFVTRA